MGRLRHKWFLRVREKHQIILLFLTYPNMALPQVSKIKELLHEYEQDDVKIFCAYIQDLLNAKEKNSEKMKNWWMAFKNEDYFANAFVKIAKEWLLFDWINITLQSTWISLNHVAYKNKMMKIYPESLIDLELVYRWDTFSSSKESGKVIYSHKIADPFVRKDVDILWGYIVIKNRRWEFITHMGMADILKCKATAKTQDIWDKWFPQMCRKTIGKAWYSQHFRDEFQVLEEIDNENYDPTITTPEKRSEVDEINAITTIEELKAYWEANKGKWKEFAAEITRRKSEILDSLPPDLNLPPK